MSVRSCAFLGGDPEGWKEGLRPGEEGTQRAGKVVV